MVREDLIVKYIEHNQVRLSFKITFRANDLLSLSRLSLLIKEEVVMNSLTLLGYVA